MVLAFYHCWQLECLIMYKDLQFIPSSSLQVDLWPKKYGYGCCTECFAHSFWACTELEFILSFSVRVTELPGYPNAPTLPCHCRLHLCLCVRSARINKYVKRSHNRTDSVSHRLSCSWHTKKILRAGAETITTAWEPDLCTSLLFWMRQLWRCQPQNSKAGVEVSHQSLEEISLLPWPWLSCKRDFFISLWEYSWFNEW